MIEAALLALELLFVIVLLIAVNRASKPGAEKNLGIFGFYEVRIESSSDTDIKTSNRVKGKKGGHGRA